MTEAVLNLVLAVLILGLAAWAILAREAFAAVIGFLAFGLLLTLVWVQLSGIDVALTEAAIGGGLTSILLMFAATRLRASEVPENPAVSSRTVRLFAAGVSATVSLALIVCVFALPASPPSLAPEVAVNIAATGVGNPITAVLLAFRAMDTLLEAIVLLFALIGVWSLAPDDCWNPGLCCAHSAAAGHHCRCLYFLDRCGLPGWQVSRGDDPCCDVAAGHDGRAGRCAGHQ